MTDSLFLSIHLGFFLALWLQEVILGHTDMYNLSLRGLFFFLQKNKTNKLDLKKIVFSYIP